MNRTNFISAIILAIAVTAIANTVFAAAPENPEVVFKRDAAFPDFEVMDVAGQVIKTAELRKAKALVITFSNKLPPEIIPMINELAGKYGNKVVFLDIVMDTNIKPKEIVDYYENAKAMIVPAFDAEGKLGKRFALAKLPCVLIVDKDGKVVYMMYYLTNKIIDEGIQQALGLMERPVFEKR